MSQEKNASKLLHFNKFNFKGYNNILSKEMKDKTPKENKNMKFIKENSNQNLHPSDTGIKKISSKDNFSRNKNDIGLNLNLKLVKNESGSGNNTNNDKQFKSFSNKLRIRSSSNSSNKLLFKNNNQDIVNTNENKNSNKLESADTSFHNNHKLLTTHFNFDSYSKASLSENTSPVKLTKTKTNFNESPKYNFVPNIKDTYFSPKFLKKINSNPNAFNTNNIVYNENVKFLYDNSNWVKYNYLDKAKKGNKSSGNVVAFGVNTNVGNVRNYNEDRVSIILNVINPYISQITKWPRTSFFAIYDGHGGNKCADFLKENLHQYIFRDKNILSDPKLAILRGFEEAERNFIALACPDNKITDSIDKSGSCALVVIIIEDDCWVANLGDSRALLSEDSSNRLYALTRDHKPSDPIERDRIENAGGSVYQIKYNFIQTNKSELGPCRILPGKLSVSRSIGDIEAKLEILGGKPEVLSAIPQIHNFKINPETDFIVLGCDGIFEKLTNTEVIHSIWSMSDLNILGSDINEQCARCADIIIRNCLDVQSNDNLTCIIIGFENFNNTLFNNSSIGSGSVNESRIATATANGSRVATAYGTRSGLSISNNLTKRMVNDHIKNNLKNLKESNFKTKHGEIKKSNTSKVLEKQAVIDCKNAMVKNINFNVDSPLNSSKNNNSPFKNYISSKAFNEHLISNKQTPKNIKPVASTKNKNLNLGSHSNSNGRIPENENILPFLKKKFWKKK